ncbi:MAG: NUDIX hydrolase [Candidatus Absconditicoccaceae bacterium]
MNKYSYLEKPKIFDKKADIVSIFCECKGKILSLLRNPERFQGNTRGGPAGKFELERDRDLESAAYRELIEETGIDLEKLKKEITYLGKHYVKYPDDFDFEYHKFKLILDEEPDVILNNREHIDKVRNTPQDTIKLNLILGEDEVIQYYYGIK